MILNICTYNSLVAFNPYRTCQARGACCPHNNGNCGSLQLRFFPKIVSHFFYWPKRYGMSFCFIGVVIFTQRAIFINLCRGRGTYFPMLPVVDCWVEVEVNYWTSFSTLPVPKLYQKIYSSLLPSAKLLLQILWPACSGTKMSFKV